MKRFFVILLLSQLLLAAVCQGSDKPILIGGLDRYNDSIPPQVLEQANLRVWYSFDQVIKYEDKPKIMTDTMVLVLGSNYSIYYDWNREIKYKKMINQLDLAKSIAKNIHYDDYISFSEYATHESRLYEFKQNRENSEILKNRNKQLIITTDLDDNDIAHEKYFLLEENIPPQNWQFLNDTLTVLGYSCQKATCIFRGRTFTAWFTLDIPINDGPFKFYGLPGLILQLEDSESLFKFNAIGIEKVLNSHLVSEYKKIFIKSTPEQYKQIKKRMQTTLFLYYHKGETIYISRKTLPIEYSQIEHELKK